MMARRTGTVPTMPPMLEKTTAAASVTNETIAPVP